MKVRNVEAHLLEDKMDEAVTHYINTHQANEPVHIDTNGIPMTVQDDGAGRVTVMHQQTYTTQMCRQVSVTEQVGEGPWGEELLEGPIAAIVAHLQNSRHHPPPHHKVAQVRSDVDTSVILDGSMRFNGQTLDQQTEPIVVQLPPMQTLPPLQDMKRCADTNWFSDKNKKDEQSLVQQSESAVLELAASSPAHCKQQSRKSLPHKKRISRKLKRNNGNTTPQQDLVVINCSESVTNATGSQEQILPDTYVTVPHHATHMSHEVRPMFICQICGDYYGEEQLKFYHHLKQHYEPHATIIIENPVPDLAMDKMTNNCIVDNVATLPDSIVELSLENTVPKTIYQPIDKHILYTTSDKTLTFHTNKVQYSMASIDKEPTVQSAEAEKSDLYETLEKFGLYNCGKCSKTFRKQKQCEAHMREAHSSNTKLEDMGEFSEPEDLMAGIQVCVEEQYEHTLPHLTVDNGHVTQEHSTHWYSRGNGGGGGGGGAACGAGGYCGVCAREPETQPLKILKEEVLQRIFDSEVSDNANFADNMMPEHDVGEHSHDHEQTHEHIYEHNELSQEHNEHSQEMEHSHRHTEHSHEIDHSQRHNQHSHEIDHSQRHNQHSHEMNHSHRHSEPSHRHNEHSHELNHSLRHNDHNVHRHEMDHGHSQDNRGHEHNEHGHERIEDDGDRHNEHIYEHNEHSQEAVPAQVFKQEVLRKEDIEPGDVKSKQFECLECDRVFSHRNSLLYHVLSHAGKQHACRHCEKDFYTIGALKIHERVHNGDRPYKCEVCGREFRQWSDLKYHKVSLHSDKKHHKCEFCGKEFARKYSLNVHVRIHTGEKNYKCDYCTKTFRASSYRLQHMRTHTGVRPHKCEQCEKSFRSTFDLRRHMLVHDKIRDACDDPKQKPKDVQKKTKMTDTKEEKVESPTKRIKQVALASTTRLPTIMRKVPKPKKSPKKGAPNVTIQNKDAFKINNEYTNNVEVYDNRTEYAKFKNVYSETEASFKSQIVYEDETIQQKNLAVLRPFRTQNLDPAETEKPTYRTENTDGKLHVFTHIEKGKEYNGSIVSNTQVLGEIRHLEKEVAREVRSEISGEGMETGFLERLTAMYNIPAV